MTLVTRIDKVEETHSWWQVAYLRRNVCAAAILCLGAFSLGYDGSYLSGLQALDTWNAYFDTPSGYRLSIISAVPYLVMLATSPFYGWLMEIRGRRPALVFAAFLIIAGALVGTFAKNEAMLLVGRAIVGPGGGIAFVTSNVLAAEITHPNFRIIGASMVGSSYYFGSVVSAWVSFAVVAAEWPSDWAWRVPTLLQVVGPSLLLAGLYFVPESPRWLIAQGRTDEAHEILGRHHGPSKDDPLVLIELDEITEAIETEKRERLGFRSLLSSPGNRRRLLVTVVAATGTQLNGISVFSYFLTPVLRTVGVTSSLQQTAVLGGLSVWNLVFACIGAATLERFGRRTLWLTSTFGMLGCFIFIIALSAAYDVYSSTASGVASIAFIFLAFAFYDLAWSPMSYSYANELMPFSLRASTSALVSWLQYVGLTFSQWVNPLGLEAGGWRFYFLYLGTLITYCILIYLYFPETKGLTLEEVGRVFDHLDDEKTSQDVERAGPTPEKSPKLEQDC